MKKYDAMIQRKTKKRPAMVLLFVTENLRAFQCMNSATSD